MQSTQAKAKSSHSSSEPREGHGGALWRCDPIKLARVFLTQHLLLQSALFRNTTGHTS